MTLEADLLERGYFPREVPPTFTSESFAAHVTATGSVALEALAGQKSWTALCRHNLARAGGLRRPLSIPNPIGFTKLAREVGASWATDLDPLLVTSQLSASRPVLSIGPRAIQSIGFDDIEERRALSRRGARVVLHTDIQNFYPSIYTHSIAWALHTKAVAKSSVGNFALVGNRLDRAFNSCQEGQTNGIPIGPDPSLIIAECIMASIEQDMHARIANLRGYRWIDDFELSFNSIGEAENALTTLQELLSEFQLSLNPRKTRISELPEPQERPGIWEFRRWAFNTGKKAQSCDIVAYFDRLAENVATDRGGTVAAYAIARLQSFSCHPANWSLLQSLLLQILVAEPSCARQVVEHFAVQRSRGLPMDQGAFAHALETIAERHAPMGHGSEIAWVVWAAITHQVTLTSNAASAISKMDDCLVALLTLHARSLGLTPTGLNVNDWQSLMVTNQLRTEYWLLAYEASIKGWLPSVGGVDHIAADPFFSSLRGGGVSFYDMAANPLPTATQVFGGGGPARSAVN